VSELASEMRRSHRTEVCALITALLFFALVVLDIVVVEGIFRPAGLWNVIWLWNIIFWTVIILLPITVAIRLQTHLPLYVPLLVAFGLEDTAFYMLQLRLPMYYVGVSILGIWEPNRDIVLMLNLFAVVIVAMIESFYHVSHFSRHISWKGLRRSAFQKTSPETSSLIDRRD